MDPFISSLMKMPCMTIIPPGKIQTALKSGQISISEYGKNEIIHFDGDQCNHMAVILEGNVAVERIDEEGHLMTVTDFGIGQSIGANLVFSSNPNFPMTVTAKKKTKLVCLEKELLLDLCTTNEDFLLLFLKNISDHTLVLGNKIKYHVNSSIRDKVVYYLFRQYTEQKSLTVKMTITKTALAERMGIQRTSLSRELQKMQGEGLIQLNGKFITIIDKSIVTG